MGIPTYFRSIISRDRSIISGATSKIGIDYLFVDFNSIVYNVWATMDKGTGDLEKRLIENVVKTIRKMIDIVRPKKYAYLSMDGTAPRAKMVQQRSRRYKSIQLKGLTKDKRKDFGFDPSPNISPGTIFMENLQKALKNLILNMSEYKIYLNDSNHPGEGEHKFLSRLRNLVWKNNEKKVAVYSPDGDMITLCMLTNKKNIYIMRIPDKFSENEKVFVDNYDFIYCDLNKIRETFYKELTIRYKDSHVDELRILLDYNFLLLLVGNDFVPSLHFLKIRSGGDRLLIDIYGNIRLEIKDYLIEYNPIIDEKPRINMMFLEKIFIELSKREQSEFKKFQDMIHKEQSGQTSQKRNEMEKDMTPDEIFCSRLEHVPLCNPDNPLFHMYNDEFNKINFYSEKHEWKKQYYSHFIHIESDYNMARTNMVINYFESLVFTLYYYTKGCPSWSWYYRYRVSPIPSDMLTVIKRFHFDLNDIKFEKGSPYEPFQQLLFVLPPQMDFLIPHNLRYLLKNYPTEFRVDALAGIKYIYSEAILPDLELVEIDKNLLTLSEKKRNTLHNKIFTSHYKN